MSRPYKPLITLPPLAKCREAETVRRDWLTAWAKAKAAPKGTGAFLASALAKDGHMFGDYSTRSSTQALAADWLGVNSGDLIPANTTEHRTLVIALVQVLACYEAQQDQQYWRRDGTGNDTGRYLRFLASIGYPLSDVEQFAVSKKTA